MPSDKSAVRNAAPPHRAPGAGWCAAGHTGFASELHLPLACQALGGAPSQSQRDATERSNAANLAFLLHGIDLDAAPRVADEQLEEALKPIRTKLDMILGMLARLSFGAVELPPCRRIELDERRIGWQSEQSVRSGEWLRIAIHFDAVFREPIILYAQAIDAIAVADAEWRNQAALADISEPVIEDLARLALLVQRRQRSWRNADAAARGA